MFDFDQDQAIAQLKALGYSENEKIYLRFFYPSGDSRKDQDKGRKVESVFPTLPILQIETMQREGRGAYFVVNGQGHSDREISQGRALFYEHDDLELEESRDYWQRLGLPEPTIQVNTGGKSIHSYWTLEQPMEIKAWRTLQADLIEVAGADSHNQNPSRVLRLAGGYHIKPGRDPVRSEIIGGSGKQYSAKQLRSHIPLSSSEIRWKDFDRNFKLPYSARVPLEVCLSRQSRSLLNSGAAQGSRNSNGYTLACDLLGLVKEFETIGQRYDGDPYQLFEQFCDRCSPPIDSGERFQIWNSAEQRSTGATLSPNLIEACAKHWAWKTQREEERHNLSPDQQKKTTLSNMVAIPTTAHHMLISELKAALCDLSERSLSKSDLTAELLTLAEHFKLPLRTVESFYSKIQKDLDQNSNAEAVQQALETLVSAQTASLDLSEILPKQYAAPILQLAEWLALKPEVFLVALLTGVSGSFRNGTQICLHRAQGFNVSPNLFTAIVAESSQRKSPILNAMIRKPLNVLQREFAAKYKLDKAAYDHAVKNTPDGEEPPSEPQRRILYINRTTGEAIPRQAARVPDQPMIYFADEIAALFTSLNAYRGGRGSDTQDLLEYYDGYAPATLRVDGLQNEGDPFLLAIIGSIQLAILEKLMGDGRDSDGKWARFLFVIQPLTAAVLADDDHEINLDALMVDLYRKVQALPQLEFSLKREAFRYYQPIYNRLEQLRVEHPSTAMRAAYGKIQGRIGKIAACLHTIHAIAADVEFVPEIPKWAIEQAAKICYFGLQQIQSIYQGSDDSEESLLSHGLLAILNLAKNKQDWITASDANSLYERKKFKWKGEDIRELFAQLTAAGYGEIEGEGRKMRFRAFAKRQVEDTPKVENDSREDVIPRNDSDTQAQNKNVSQQSILPMPPDIDEWCCENFELGAAELIKTLSELIATRETINEYELHASIIVEAAQLSGKSEYWQFIESAVMANRPMEVRSA